HQGHRAEPPTPDADHRLAAACPGRFRRRCLRHGFLRQRDVPPGDAGRRLRHPKSDRAGRALCLRGRRYPRLLRRAPFHARRGALMGGYGGLAAAVLVGGLFGLMLAVLVVTYRVDQIIAGVAINLLVLGLTSYAASQVLTTYRELNNAPIFRAIEIPFLSDLPIVGPILFRQNLFVYAAFIIVAIATYYLFHTRSGLRARAVGEHPEAADSLGINVFSTRYINVVIGGMVAGFGGAWFTLGSVGRFDDNMTGGRGYIGLAAMIVGRWHPVGALLAALVFG